MKKIDKLSRYYYHIMLRNETAHSMILWWQIKVNNQS